MPARDWNRLSSEELVARYLRAHKLKHISTVHHIERRCRRYWVLRDVWRAASTYRRAFQRLLADGELGNYRYTDVRGIGGRRSASPAGYHYQYRVFHLRRPVSAARLARLAPTSRAPRNKSYSFAMFAGVKI